VFSLEAPRSVDLRINALCHHHLWEGQSKLCCNNSGFGHLCQEVSVLLEWRLHEVSWFPEIWCQIAVGVAQSLKACLHEIALGLGVTTRGGEAITDTGKRQHLLAHRRANNVGTTRSRDQSDTHGTALAVHLEGHSVRETETSSPVSTSDWDQLQLGGNDSSSDGCCNFLGALGTKANVTILITNEDMANETIALTGRSHLLDRVDLHDFILQGTRGEEGINDLVFLDWQGVEVNVLNGVDLALLAQTSKLGHWHPLLLVSLALALSLLASLLTFLASLLTKIAFTKTTFAPHGV